MRSSPLPRHRLLRAAAVALGVVALAAVPALPVAGADPSPVPSAAPAAFATADPATTVGVPVGFRLIVKPVFHVAVKTLLTNPASGGHQLGDLRVLPATELYDEQGYTIGDLNAMLLTTSVDVPAAGDEVRMSRLDFILDRDPASPAAGPDQVIVSGSGYYPGDQSTIAVGKSLIRPIIGGSGAYAGATGWADTMHLEDGSWRHTLYIILPELP
jgi:hypothetical protein